MTTENKQALLGLLGGAALLFITVKVFKADKDKKEKQPEVTEASISAALIAYQDAMNDNQNLDEMNEELKKEFGLTVQFKAMENKFIVKDLKGNVVREQ